MQARDVPLLKLENNWDCTRTLIGQLVCLNGSMLTRLSHHTKFDWLCVVRCKFSLVDRKYECLSRKSKSKSVNTSFLHLSNFFREIFYKSNRGLFPLLQSLV